MELRIQCAKCGAEYRVEPEKIKGKPARLTCKKCQQLVRIVPAPGGDFEVQGGTLKSPLEPRLPEQIGSFRILKAMASGGMGDIYLAKQVGAEGFEREVVLKVLHPHLARDVNFAKALVDEAKITVRLHHPNIVQMFNLERHGELFFTVMEHVPGKSLAAIQRAYRRMGRSMALPMAVYIACEVLEGLAYAHELKDENGVHLEIVHRDISPSNIVVSREGWVKIIDFGIAKAQSRLSQTQPGIIKGKFAYMAPEQFVGSVDARADLFSLGVVLWECLAGVRLFYSHTDVDTLQKLLHLDPPPINLTRPDIPDAMNQILTRALEKDPLKRFQSAREFRAALLSFIAPMSIDEMRKQVDIEPGGADVADLFKDTEEEKTEQTPVMRAQDMRAHPGTIPPPAKAHQKPGRPRWLTPVLAAALLLVAAGGFWWWQRQETNPRPAADAGLAGSTLEELRGPTDGSPPQEMDGAAPSADAGTAPGIAPEAAPAADGGTADGQSVANATPNAPVFLSRETVSRIMRRSAARFQACADRHLAKLGQARSVRLSLDFSIASGGQVTQAGISPESLAATDFGRCLLEALRRVPFPRHRDKSVSISFPLEFEALKPAAP